MLRLNENLFQQLKKIYFPFRSFVTSLSYVKTKIKIDLEVTNAVNIYNNNIHRVLLDTTRTKSIRKCNKLNLW